MCFYVVTQLIIRVAGIRTPFSEIQVIRDGCI